MNENKFVRNGKEYVAVVSTSTCDGCAFEADEFCRVRTPSCDSDKRSDGRNVIFVEAPNPEPKPKTNADRIREISNEELAGFIDRNVKCSICSAKKFCDIFPTEKCKVILLHWLNSPAEAESEGK